MRAYVVLALLGVAAFVGMVNSASSSAEPVALVAVHALVAVPEQYRAAAEPAPQVIATDPAAPAQPVGRRAAGAMVAHRVAPVVVPGTPCRSDARACVDLSGNRAWLIRGGAVSYGPVPITSGRKGFRTPPGTFTVDFHSRNHVSSIYNAPMPYSVFFNGGIAFHQGSLSERSHGCIHLSRTAAREFFNSLSRGDFVQVV